VGEKWIQIVVRKPEGKGQLGRPGCRWEVNIGIYVKEWGVDCIQMAQDGATVIMSIGTP
jgi:hypothetical protein